MQERKTLEGWDEISTHLKAARKTILARGFPIRRYMAGDKPRVYAIVEELEQHKLKGAFIAGNCQ